MQLLMRNKTYFAIVMTFFLFVYLVLFININIAAQENGGDDSYDSIYIYLTPEEAFFLIAYSNLEELKKMAISLGISFPEDVTIEKLRELLYKYYNFTEIRKEKSDEVLYIKSTDIINISEEDKIIDLIGNNLIVYKGYLFKADRIIFYLDEEVFFGYGNVSLKSSNFFCTAESFEYSIPKKNGVLNNATIYVDKYIISSNKANISNNNVLTTEKATVTQCDMEKPHYYLIVNKVLYSESILYFYDIEFVIGSEKLLFFPLYISYERGYSYPLLFGMDYGYREGFMFFNTLIRKNYEMYIDIYERLGIYLGFKTSFKWKNGNFSLVSGFAISPDLFYDDYNNSWTIIPPDDEFTFYNINLRAGLYGTLKLNVFKGFTINLNYSYYSDPYFKFDYFSRERFLRFDITQFSSFDWQNDSNIFPSSNLSFNEELSTSFKILNFNVNIASSLYFTASKNSSIGESVLNYYLYSPKYYQYYISSIKWYSTSFGGNLLNVSKDWFSFSISNSNFSNYYTYYDSNSELQKESFIATTTINPNFSLKFDFLTYSFSMNNNLSYSKTTTEDTSESLIYYTTISNSLNFLIPLLRISFNLSQSYRNSLLEPIDFGWLSNRASASLIFNPFSFLSFSASLNYNFLESENGELWVFSIENFDIVNLSAQFKDKYLTFTWNGKYYIDIQSLTNQQFNFSLAIPKIKLLFFWFNISNTMSLRLDQTNPFSQLFENNFNMTFSIDNEIQINFRVSSYNQFLYRYSSLEEAIIDLINSFNFFDYYARLYSYFDLRSISLSITRFLHDMTVQFQIAGSFVLSSDKTQYNFVISYSIYIISTFLSGYEFSENWENVF